MSEVARRRALRLLEKRDYSRKALIGKLTEKGVSEEDAAETVDRLCEVGAVSDERCAELIVRHYSLKGYGERRIRDELFRRGIPRELWEQALSRLPETGDAAYRLLESRLRGSGGSPEDIRKAQNHLLRRGYSWEEIRAALERFQVSEDKQ